MALSLSLSPSSNRRRALFRLWQHHSFHVHIATIFAALIFLACAAIVWTNYIHGYRMALAAAETSFEGIHRERGRALATSHKHLEVVVTALKNAPVTEAESLSARMQSLQMFVDILNSDPWMATLYVGYENGDFFLVRPFRSDAERKPFDAPPHAAFVVQSIERATGFEPRFLLLDRALNTISQTTPANFNVDPRQRPWYADAVRTNKTAVTAPYVFLIGAIGITVAARAGHGRAVVGVDMRLDDLAKSLEQSRVTPATELAIYDDTGHVAAFSAPGWTAAAGADGKPMLPRVGEVSAVLGAGAANPGAFAAAAHTAAGGREWMMKITTIDGASGSRYKLAIAMPLDELLAESRSQLLRNLLAALFIVAISVPVSYWVARRIAGNLNVVIDQAAAIRRFDFTEMPLPKTRVKEIFALGRAMRDTRSTIRKFIELSTALASERKFDVLLNRVLQEARDAAGARGGVVYLLEEDNRTLKLAARLGIGATGSGGEPPVSLSLADSSNPVVMGLTQAHAADGADADELRVINVPASRPAGLAFLDADFGAAPVMMVSERLCDRAGVPIGVMCLFLPGDAGRPTPERLAFVDAFAGAGAVAIDNQRLLLAQKALLDALIGLVASAIDAKSVYTGGHCQRVPELTLMLVKAACDARQGPLAGFTMNDDEWEALRIAAWLHDCGKVTTPEYVVDKATKLETIYDRIHEIRTRFEVLKRDAEIACLKATMTGGDAESLRAALAEQWRTLDEEFRFIAACNEGGESMAPADIERVQAIGKRTWQRTLSDRLGVSRDVAARMQNEPEPALPVAESLLADKAWHRVAHHPGDLIAADNPWGFQFKAPQYQFNHGEVYNLCVSRGTLTDEERYKINTHIVHTIIMLSKLPFPGVLKTVPELAGGHHEKMDGSGYPRKLRRDQMSVQARAMAIADIFEALTASDRPYKKAKMLSESVEIMSRMRQDAHIDGELFELFLTSGVYKDYARRFLPPEYIDEVEIGRYVSSAPAAVAAGASMG